MKILLADSFDESLPKKLAPFGEATTDVNQLPDADVVLIRSKTKVTREYLAGAPKLKLVIRGGVGLDNVDIEACREKGIEVKNTPRASSVAVAELTMALMLAVPNRLIEGHNSMKDGKWLKKELKRTELFGKTLGLLGAGLIGTEVARRALAFGMKVVAYDHYIPNHALAELLDEPEELYAKADYISVHLPLTPETRGMLNRQAFAQMKNGVVIVNTARGKVVAEEDMAEALKSGKVAAYATDVYLSDPPDPKSPLLSAPNVVLMPHVGGSSRENLLRIGENVVEILKKWTKSAAKSPAEPGVLASR
ncbi:MAG TPA: hydroxyacid dehydrogenase [Thermoanaerobaculia bacterium]|nr:hydroxyacid dehydrogenase [Thermoanaerobaculia bacterium]HQR68721.1 hydroxyacid dehydrogenase [Thermoanaerobaculia bacterium]